MSAGILDSEKLRVNQLINSSHPYAFELWNKGCANNWMPTNVNMSKDVQQWQDPAILSDDEKLLVERCLGFFASTESLVGDNLLQVVAKYVTDGACRQYIARQNFEESLHNATISVCCSALNLNQHEVAEAYKNIPAIKAKSVFLSEISSDLGRPDFDIKTLEGKREFLSNLITYYIICEGTFFYSGFAMLLSLGRQNKLRGVADQIRYTLRDESLHIQFGTYLINTIRDQYPEIWDDVFEKLIIARINRAVDLEIMYARDVLPRGILGLSAEMFVDYMQFIANRRMEGIRISYRYKSDKNPFSWMSEQADASAQTNFFEVHVRDYQTSAVLSDDF